MTGNRYSNEALFAMDARVKPAHGDFGKRRCQWPRQSFRRGAMLCAIIDCAVAAKGLDRHDEGRYSSKPK
jgi:hypothetical protein